MTVWWPFSGFTEDNRGPGLSRVVLSLCTGKKLHHCLFPRLLPVDLKSSKHAARSGEMITSDTWWRSRRLHSLRPLLPLTLHTGDSRRPAVSSSGTVDISVAAALLNGHFIATAVGSAQNHSGSVRRTGPVPGLLSRGCGQKPTTKWSGQRISQTRGSHTHTGRSVVSHFPLFSIILFHRHSCYSKICSHKFVSS